MVLQMSRPTKHPVTGIYQLRKRVPRHLQDVVGKSVIKVSLKTRDPVAAKVAHANALAEIEARWLQLSAGVVSLNQKQATAMAGEIYRTMTSQYEDNPGDPALWKTSLIRDHLFLRPERGVKFLAISQDQELVDRHLNMLKRNRNDEAIFTYLDHHGYRIDDPSLEMLRKAVASAVMQAKEHILKMSEGDYRPDPDADRFPVLDLTRRDMSKAIDEKFLLTAIFESYAKEKQIKIDTYKKWKPFISLVSKDISDIRNLTREWVIDWKDKLIGSGLSPQYVNESHLACLSVVCNWAVLNARIPSNPTHQVKALVPKQRNAREKYFTNEEAKTILAATLLEFPARLSDEMKAARRWIPWLCAYTGARVGEISQLRREDIQQHGDHWLIWITPEAGGTKNDRARFVAVHEHLIEQGFIQFVAGGGRKGSIFYDPNRRRGGDESHPQYEKVGERLAQWVRSLGITDKRISPNHAWRHLFKTKARTVGMDVGARDYMQGHAPATEGEAYGSFEASVLAREINKIERFQT